MELFVCESPGVYRVARADEALEGAKTVMRQHYGVKPTLGMAEDSKRFFWSRLAGEEREIFAVAFLDSNHRVIACEDLFFGTIATASVYPREVVKRALHHNAASVMVAHNHPSGNPEPSYADRSITTNLASALRLVEINVIDHIVVGQSECVSFSERGWM